MRKIYLTNSFSFQMLDGDGADIQIRKVSANFAETLLSQHNVENCIGHTDTATIVQNILAGVKLPPAERKSVLLKRTGEGNTAETAIVAQYSGGRLPEGVTTLLERAKITFWLVLTDYAWNPPCIQDGHGVGYCAPSKNCCGNCTA